MFFYTVTETPASADLIRHRRWQWIGHVLRKESTNVPEQRLRGNHLEEEFEGDRKIHGEGWWRSSETSLVGGVGESCTIDEEERKMEEFCQ